jgi:hypothetical protein
MRLEWLRFEVDSWGAIGEGDGSVASAPSLRPSAERWPLRDAVRRGAEAPLYLEATATTEAGPLRG